MRFDCPRTCPYYEKEDICRFMPIFEALTDIKVYSETVKFDLKVKDQDAAKAAVLAMNGQVIGYGKHKLYSSEVSGLALKLPGWTYPIIITDEGEVFGDNFGGRWGDQKTLDKFKEEYVYKVVEGKAALLGWACQRTDKGITVFHPKGGYIEISGNNMEAFNFEGNSCHEAIEPLVQELGVIDYALQKPSFRLQQNRNIQQ